MSDIQSSFTSHAKKDENFTHKKEKNQSIEADPAVAQMIELAKNLKQLLGIHSIYSRK